MKTPTNKHNVPKKQWNKWSLKAKAIFNSLYHAMTRNQEHFSHADAPSVPKKYFKVTAWNAAWTAATECDWLDSNPIRPQEKNSAST